MIGAGFGADIAAISVNVTGVPGSNGVSGSSGARRLFGAPEGVAPSAPWLRLMKKLVFALVLDRDERPDASLRLKLERSPSPPGPLSPSMLGNARVWARRSGSLASIRRCR